MRSMVCNIRWQRIVVGVLGMVVLPLLVWSQGAAPYKSMAPVEQYRMQRDAELEMARSAAPESISRNAEILVLGAKAYETAAKGTNGFVCMVQRSWAAGLDDVDFWNPKLRGPICMNAAAAHSILPHVLKKAEWALAGLSKEQMGERIAAAFRSGELTEPAPGAMCYMMSKQGYLSEADKQWRPHMMFFTPATDLEAWGAGLKGSPLLGFKDATEHFSVFLLPVSKWSDGTPGPAM